jgi:hypothetical protein
MAVVSCAKQCFHRFVVFCRAVPFGAFIAFLLSLKAWIVAHRKIDDVVEGLYDNWQGASDTRDKINALDTPFAIICILNLVSLLLSFTVADTICQESATGVLKSKMRVRACIPSIVWVSVFGIVSFLLLLSTISTLLLSHGLLILWLLLKVLSVFCRLPGYLLPEADGIIDNLDHPVTAGLDLVQYCPEHAAVNEDAFDLLVGSAILTIAQAGMLACITSSAELVNFDMFHLSSKQDDDDVDEDPDGFDEEATENSNAEEAMEAS